MINHNLAPSNERTATVSCSEQPPTADEASKVFSRLPRQDPSFFPSPPFPLCPLFSVSPCLARSSPRFGGMSRIVCAESCEGRRSGQGPWPCGEHSISEETRSLRRPRSGRLRGRKQCRLPLWTTVRPSIYYPAPEGQPFASFPKSKKQ